MSFDVIVIIVVVVVVGGEFNVFSTTLSVDADVVRCVATDWPLADDIELLCESSPTLDCTTTIDGRLRIAEFGLSFGMERQPMNFPAGPISDCSGNSAAAGAERRKFGIGFGDSGGCGCCGGGGGIASLRIETACKSTFLATFWLRYRWRLEVQIEKYFWKIFFKIIIV